LQKRPRFNSQKIPTKPQFSDTPTLPRGYPPFCQKGLLLYHSITNTLEWIGSMVGLKIIPIN
jgi:hypothetical protein